MLIYRKGIKLERDVYDALANEGDKTETFSDIVKRLLVHYRNCVKK